MLHKTETKAVGGLAHYLKASGQSLDGVVGRLEADGLVVSGPDPTDGRSRRCRSGRNRSLRSQGIAYGSSSGVLSAISR
jgi:hypothetical protein